MIEHMRTPGAGHALLDCCDSVGTAPLQASALQLLDPESPAKISVGAPASSRMRTRSRTSPRYSALWKPPMTSPRMSLIFSILASFSVLPVHAATPTTHCQPGAQAASRIAGFARQAVPGLLSNALLEKQKCYYGCCSGSRQHTQQWLKPANQEGWRGCCCCAYL